MAGAEPNSTLGMEKEKRLEKLVNIFKLYSFGWHIGVFGPQSGCPLGVYEKSVAQVSCLRHIL